MIRKDIHTKDILHDGGLDLQRNLGVVRLSIITPTFSATRKSHGFSKSETGALE